MKSTLNNTSRLLLVIAALGLVIVLFKPIWRIELAAPQYPEGLNLQIHASGLRGNVDIINGLNHYIGMKTLHNEDFIEFTLLPYIIIFFVLGFLATAVINKRRWLHILFAGFVAFGVIAMVDFWRWEYNYGHNLDPNAAIIVPGMAYQPPLIGFKQLLNFGAYSIPDTGGWIFIAAGVLLLACVILEWQRHKYVKSKAPAISVAALLLACAFTFPGCQSGPVAILTGTDNCYYCKMTIADARYAAELVTTKGKVYKFDDLHCLRTLLNAGSIEKQQVKTIYLADFAGDHSLVKATDTYLLRGDAIHAPMNGDIIAFKNHDSMKAAAVQLDAALTSWEELIK